MAKRNGAVNAWAVALLEIGPHDRVLDVGCGPGLALALSAERATEGFVAGVDHSDVMVRHARRRNRAAIEAGRVEVRLGSASELPYSDRHFTKACAVNSLQFWTSAEEGLRELWRVLAPGGRLLVVMRMRCEGAGRFDRSRYGVTDSRLAEVLTALGATEFSDVTAERGDVGGETYTAVLARRPRRPSAP
jgi:SAM-dependent methyltransferase